MPQPYKNDTMQERYVSAALDEYGYVWVEQCDWFPPYVVDFYLPELCMVIEADGHYGHFRKREIKRDMDLMDTSMVDYILHIKSRTLEGIREELWQALSKYQEEEVQPVNLKQEGNQPLG